jgi:hypothetical protein
MGLATQLRKGATNRASVIIPMVRRIHAKHQSTDYDSDEDFDPQVYRMQSDNAHQFDGCGCNAARRDRDIPGKQDNNAREIQGGRRFGRNPGPRGQYPRPGLHGPYILSVSCEAGRRTGHVAANCNVLAIALFIEKYKRDMDSESKDDLKQAWLSRWRKTGGKIGKKPRQVLRTYADLLDLTVNKVDDQFCWDC